MIQTLNRNSLIVYYFDLQGIYNKSQLIKLPSDTYAIINDVKLYKGLNQDFICPTIKYNTDTETTIYNKDGSLAKTFTGAINRTVSYVIDYKHNSYFIDPFTGIEYSIIRYSVPPSYPFTTSTDYAYYNLYIKGIAEDLILNKNFSVRSTILTSSQEDTKYEVVLNSKVDTSKLIRIFEEVNGNPESLFYYVTNLSPSSLQTIFEYNKDDQPTINNTITTISFSQEINLSNSYYITFPKGNEIVSIPILSITKNQIGQYVFQLEDVNSLRVPPSNNFYGPYLYLTTLNENIYYNLQFFPGSINLPVFYTIELNGVVIPNRRLRENPLKNVRTLNDLPYIYLAIYSVNSEDVNDKDVVNIVYDNNPNRDRVAIFQLFTTEASLNSNYVTYTTKMKPRIKFQSQYRTLRIQLLDRFGTVLLFDNTPYKPDDQVYEGSVVPEELMNCSVQFLLTKI